MNRMKIGIGSEAIAVAILNRFSEAFARHDLPALMALFAPGGDAVFVDGESGAAAVGASDIKAYLAAAARRRQSSTWIWDQISVSGAGAVLSVAAQARVRIEGVERTREVPRRLTAVLQRQGERWVILQLHVSAPAVAADDTHDGSLARLPAAG